jgi:hypothetical protein
MSHQGCGNLESGYGDEAFEMLNNVSAQSV